LALQLGYPHPDILLAQLSSSQISEWMAYASIEPFGEFREEIRHGRIMHLLDMAHFKRDKPLSPIDFMNFIDQPEEKELDPEKAYELIDKLVFGL
jgi:hypothetical protein